MTDKIKFLQLLSGDQHDDLIERIIQHIYRQWVKTHDFVIDGGSADGRHTLPLAHLVGSAGLVVAIEPLYSIIYKHRPWAKNYHSNCVIIREVALSDFIGTSSFNYINSNPGYSGLKNGYWPPETVYKKINVEVTTIDELTKTLSGYVGDRKLSFIKLDLEGGEFNAMMGARDALTKYHPLVIFEHARNAAPVNYSYNPADLFEMARRAEYRIFDVLGEEYLQCGEFSDKTPNYLALVPNSEQDKASFLNISNSLDLLL